MSHRQFDKCLYLAWFVLLMCGYQPVARRRVVDELVSVDTAAAVTGVSKRTLWRWLGSGSLQRQGMDERGRVMVAFSDIAPRLCVAFSAPSGGGLRMSWRCSWRLTGVIARRKVMWHCCVCSRGGRILHS